MPFSETLKLLEARKIDNATALISLQWLALNRDKLRRQWGIT